MKYQAMAGKVIVEVLEKEDETSSGLKLIRMGKVYPFKGRVVSVGSDRIGKKRTFKPPCKRGDIVHFKKGTVFQITSKFSKQNLSTVYFGDIIGVQPSVDILDATYDNIIVQIFYKDTSDVIYIPETIRKRMSVFVGHVKSIGKEYPYETVGLKAGDKVIFPRNEGFQIVIGDNQYHSLYPEHVKAKFSGDLSDLVEVE